MLNDIKEIWYTKEQLQEITSRLGAQISEDYKDKNLLLVSVLKGSVVAMADLMRAITIPCTIDFMVVSSYKGDTSTGKVKIIKDLDIDIQNYDLLIVEDILDSGVTLSSLTDILRTRNPRSLKLCTLLDKPHSRKVDIRADYVGTQIEDGFVVGYGLDYNEKYRNLPFIGVIKDELIPKAQ